MWAKNGSVTLTKGSNIVNGIGTSFTLLAEISDGFLTHDGQIYEIANIISDTQLTLGVAYSGDSVKEEAYSILPLRGGFNKALLEFQKILREFGGILSAGLTIKPNASGTTPDRKIFDYEAAGFTFLDLTEGRMYVKLSLQVGDWSEGLTLGAGPRGPEGPPVEVAQVLGGDPSLAVSQKLLTDSIKGMESANRVAVEDASLSAKNAKASETNTARLAADVKKSADVIIPLQNTLDSRLTAVEEVSGELSESSKAILENIQSASDNAALAQEAKASAAQSAAAAKASETNASKSETSSAASEKAAKMSQQQVESLALTVKSMQDSASSSASKAAASEKNAKTSETSSKADAIKAKESADAAKQSENAAKASETLVKESADNAKASELIAVTKEEEARIHADSAKQSEIVASEAQNAVNASQQSIESLALAIKSMQDSASSSASKAAASERNAKTSEEKSSDSEKNAKASELASKQSEDNAKVSETVSSASEKNAKASELASKQSEDNAKTSELASKQSEKNAKASELASKQSEDNAKVSETNSAASAKNADLSATNAALSQKTAELSEASAVASAESAAASAETILAIELESKENARIASEAATSANDSKDEAKQSAQEASTASASAKDSETKAKVSEGKSLAAEQVVSTLSEEVVNLHTEVVEGAASTEENAALALVSKNEAEEASSSAKTSAQAAFQWAERAKGAVLGDGYLDKKENLSDLDDVMEAIKNISDGMLVFGDPDPLTEPGEGESALHYKGTELVNFEFVEKLYQILEEMFEDVGQSMKYFGDMIVPFFDGDLTASDSSSIADYKPNDVNAKHYLGTKYVQQQRTAAFLPNTYEAVAGTYTFVAEIENHKFFDLSQRSMSGTAGLFTIYFKGANTGLVTKGSVLIIWGEASLRITSDYDIVMGSLPEPTDTNKLYFIDYLGFKGPYSSILLISYRELGGLQLA